MGTSIDAQNVLITHENCWDGAACSVVYKKFFPEGHVIETNYNKIPIEVYVEVLAGKDVIIADFSLPRDELLKLKDATKSLVVLDHHITAMKNLGGLDFAFFDMTKCGSHMLHDYLMEHFSHLLDDFSTRPAGIPPLPFWLQMIEAGDLYKTQEGVFDAYRGVRILHHETRHEYLNSLMDMSDEEVVEKIYAEGLVAFQAYNNNLKDHLKDKAIFTFRYIHEGRERFLPAIFAPAVFSSDAGHYLAHATNFQVGVVISLDLIRNKAVLSFRSCGEGSSAEVAKSFDGGGHTHAAGATMSMDVAFKNHIRFDQKWKDFASSSYKEDCGG